MPDSGGPFVEIPYFSTNEKESAGEKMQENRTAACTKSRNSLIFH
ncbi:hypothetical protein KNP414_01686 [Paenibacillus mucilaginosus KNP414]|uniref:Uncharacterized protein n=1 Tax=Paenibacillus mucilaginosus (strain KNP414) TaxID=1036673 RepID=F8FPM4_PAEMK|nr:hypothetical protein KNP414_01686 [Paenibacillus mucilaginosus KNP414]